MHHLRFYCTNPDSQGTNTKDMTPAEKIAAALATKEKGTEYFKAGNYERSVLKYSEVEKNRLLHGAYDRMFRC